MSRRVLLVACAAALLVSASIGAASASAAKKLVLTRPGQVVGEEAPPAATVGTTAFIGIVVNQCEAALTGAVLLNNSEVTDRFGSSEGQTNHCPHPGLATYHGTITELQLKSSGKATFKLAKTPTAEMTVEEVCRYTFKKMAGTFQTPAERTLITGSIAGKLNKKTSSPACFPTDGFTFEASVGALVGPPGPEQFEEWSNFRLG
jgi:hypothetical protein